MDMGSHGSTNLHPSETPLHIGMVHRLGFYLKAKSVGDTEICFKPFVFLISTYIIKCTIVTIITMLNS